MFQALNCTKRLKTEDRLKTQHFPNTLNAVKKNLFSLLSVCKYDTTLPRMFDILYYKKTSQFYKQIFDSFTYVRPQQWRLIIVVLILVLVLLHLLFLLPPLPLQNHLLVFLWGCAKHSDPVMTKHYN